MAEEVVFDASAILAIFKRERGAERAVAELGRSVISCVNLAEVQGKLVDAGLEERVAWEWIEFLGCRAVSFDSGQAFEAGSLIAATRPFGLSLGDRACLALAMGRRTKVYTTDRKWKSLSLGIEVDVIR